METLIYLAKASVLLSIFLCIYKLLLSRESFLQVNRIYLIVGLLLSFSLPLITFTNVEITEVEIPLQNNITEPTIAYVEQQIPIATTPEMEAVQQPTFWEEITWYEVVLSMYVLGILFFFGKLIYQSSSLLRLLHKTKKLKKKGICYYETDQKIEAFSFFNIMAYNPKLHDKNELNIIKTHEEIHIKQWHSIDMLLGNLACIFLWFLPLAYSYRASIDENLEYIADAKTAEKTKSIKQYQYTLLNYFSLETNMQYASYFFKQSSLKNRIMMLNKEKSKSVNLYKYSFILPFIIAFIWFFQTETLAKEIYIEVEKSDVEASSTSTEKLVDKTVSASIENTNKAQTESSQIIQQDSTSISTLDKIEVKINKNATDQSLKDLEDFFAEHDQKLKFSKIKRNRKGEITRIKIKLSNAKNGFKKENLISGNKPIKEYVIIRDFKNETADIKEYVSPEKDTYTLLNEAKVIFVNGNKYEKNSPLAITEVSIHKAEGDVLNINAKELEETDFGKIYKLYENDDAEREVFIFKNIEGSTKNGSSLMRLEINKPKNKFATQFESAYDKTPKKVVHTSVYVEVMPDLLEKLKNHIQDEKQVKLNGKTFNANQHKGQFILMENFSFNDDILEVTGEVKNYGYENNEFFNDYENKLSSVLSIDKNGKITVENMYKNKDAKSFVSDVSYADKRKEIRDFYENAEFVYVSDKKVAKADLINQVLTYEKFNIKNNELYFTNAKLRPNETNKGIASILIQLLKDNEKPKVEQFVIWFKSENEIEMASMSGFITSSNQKLNFKAKSNINQSEDKAYDESEIQTFFNKANQVYLDGKAIQKSKLNKNVIVFGEVEFKNEQLFFKDTDVYDDIEADNFNKVMARTILYKKMLRNRSIIWFEEADKLHYSKGNTAFYTSPKVEETFILNNDVAVDNITYINNKDTKQKPIYILDGKIIIEDEFRKINPNEIASISVIKDYENLLAELKNNSSIQKEHFNGAILIELKDEAYYKLHFKILIQKTKDGYSMQCKQGCAWKGLSFNLNRFTSQYINALGVSGNPADKNEAPEGLANFHFKIKESGNQLKLTKLEGSIWEELSFSILEGETYQLTQNGVTKK